MAYKFLQNRTGALLNLEVIPRIGDEPVNSGHPIGVILHVGENLKIEYGDNENPYLNGVSISYNIADDSLVKFDRQVVTRGGAFDNTLNQNDTLTFNAIASEVIEGSNS